jgi:DNA topoisomerase-1
MKTKTRTHRRVSMRRARIAREPVHSAKAAGLRYVLDTQPGITRKKAGKGWSYAMPDGAVVRDRAVLRRIRSLVIPPAWENVWICPLENGHIQATGRDARGRKQYRYHPRWREVRDETKYDKTIAFAEALPKIRAKTEEHLALRGLPREKVLATVVRLLEVTLIRVGNAEYARTNQSFGLTTMQDGHVDFDGPVIRFRFRGKSGKDHDIDIRDRRLAKIVRQCQAIDGEDLFQYVDDAGQGQKIESGDVNAYLKEIAGQEFTAKDFRTWAGTVLAAKALQELEQFDNATQAKKNVVQAIRDVAERLGNTPTVCRKCYVHPAILDAYLDGNLVHTLRKRADEELRGSLTDLRPEEAAVLAFLRARLARDEQRAA